jgi:hypothetical protein
MSTRLLRHILLLPEYEFLGDVIIRSFDPIDLFYSANALYRFE